MTIEVKQLVEDSNKLVLALRDAVETKADADTVSKIEAKLTEVFEEKAALEARLADIETKAARADFGETKASAAEVEYKAAFNEYLRNPADNAVKHALMSLEKKAVDTVTGPAGGFSVPKLIVDAILEAKVPVGAMRQLAEVVQVSSPNTNFLVETTGAATEWVSETGTRSTTDTPVWANVVPTFGILAAKAPITLNAQEDAQHDLTAFVINSLAKGFAKAEAESFISGNGTNRPTGILNGTTVGTLASGSATTIGTSGDIFADLTASIDPGYHADAKFVMNAKTKTLISKLKNSEGDYIFKDAISAGTTATLWGFPVVLDAFMPDVAAGAKPVLFGSIFEAYVIADRVGMSMLEDPYTSLGYVNLIARKRVGGIVRQAAAVKALRIAES